MLSSNIFHCSWTSDSSKLITVSRDGVCKVWKVCESADGSCVDLEAVHSFTPFGSVSVTALDVIDYQDGSWLVAFGAESGDLVVERLSPEGTSNTLVCKVDAKFSHGATVKRIRWRRNQASEKCTSFQFASCGEDNTVRIHDLVEL